VGERKARLKTKQEKTKDPKRGKGVKMRSAIRKAQVEHLGITNAMVAAVKDGCYIEVWRDKIDLTISKYATDPRGTTELYDILHCMLPHYETGGLLTEDHQPCHLIGIECDGRGYIGRIDDDIITEMADGREWDIYAWHDGVILRVTVSHWDGKSKFDDIDLDPLTPRWSVKQVTLSNSGVRIGKCEFEADEWAEHRIYMRYMQK